MCVDLIQSEGVLHYGPDFRAVVYLDQDLSDYYRSLIPKYKNVISLRHPAHITVVRIYKETPSIIDYWKAHEGELIKFEYLPIVKWNNIHYWLEVYSQRIGDIREELGLPRYRVGYNCYHITIGRVHEVVEWDLPQAKEQ